MAEKVNKMIKDFKLETYMKKNNRNAEKVIDVLQGMDLDFDEVVFWKGVFKCLQ